MHRDRTIRADLFLAAFLSSPLCLGGQAAPATPEELTITHAVEIALAENPALHAALAQAEAAQARVRMAKGAYYPQVRIDAIGKLGLSGATNGLGLIGLPASPFYRNLSQAGNVSQALFDFGRTKHAMGAARAEAEAARQNLIAVRIEVAQSAQEAFLKVLRAQQLLKVREQALRERQATLRKVDDYFQVGLRSKLDLDLARVSLSTAELDLTQARDDERVAWTELFAALGRPEGDHCNLVEPTAQLLPPAELADETKQALAKRPDLKALEAEIQSQEERLEYARSLRRPILNGVLSGGYARFATLTTARLLVGGLGLIAPIYTGGQLEGQVKEQEYELETLRARRSSLLLQIHTEISRAHWDLLKALESAKVNDQTSVYTEEALRLARTRYQNQLASFVDLLTAQTAAEGARAAYAQSLYDYQIAKARLDASLGVEH